MTISVYGDDERAAWAEGNADARDDALREFLEDCPEPGCKNTKDHNLRACIQHLTDDEYEAMLDAATGHEIRWIA